MEICLFSPCIQVNPLCILIHIRHNHSRWTPTLPKAKLRLVDKPRNDSPLSWDDQVEFFCALN